MALVLEPEIGVNIPAEAKYVDLRERAEAACNTALMLENHGLDIEADDIDRDVAATLALSYAKDAKQTSITASDHRINSLTPASLVQTHGILKEFGGLVATQAAELRNTVVNKLILETQNTDARIRIRALELLGKITDVGLFTDRKEITIKHQNAEELRDKLREKLVVLKRNAQGIYEDDEITKEETA